MSTSNLTIVISDRGDTERFINLKGYREIKIGQPASQEQDNFRVEIIFKDHIAKLLPVSNVKICIAKMEMIKNAIKNNNKILTLTSEEVTKFLNKERE